MIKSNHVLPPFYEQRLASDPRSALSQGSSFFEGKSAVQAVPAKNHRPPE
jgi:hypothetical protein